MQAARHHSAVTLTFNLFESRILRRILAEIIENYRLSPDQVDPKVAAVWYSTRGCQTAKMSAEETRDWLETLHGYKSANLHRLAEWAKGLSVSRAGHSQLEVTVEEASNLMTILNDHRLLAAAKHDIGQREMDMHSLAAINKLKPNQQTAVYEIHFLACLIEEILRLTAPDAANWMEE